MTCDDDERVCTFWYEPFLPVLCPVGNAPASSVARDLLYNAVTVKMGTAAGSQALVLVCWQPSAEVTISEVATGSRCGATSVGGAADR